MVPLAKFDISLKNRRFPPIFFSISLAPTNIVVRVHTKNYGKLKEFTEKHGNLCGGERN